MIEFFCAIMSVVWLVMTNIALWIDRPVVEVLVCGSMCGTWLAALMVIVELGGQR